MTNWCMFAFVPDVAMGACRLLIHPPGTERVVQRRSLSRKKNSYDFIWFSYDFTWCLHDFTSFWVHSHFSSNIPDTICLSMSIKRQFSFERLYMPPHLTPQQVGTCILAANAPRTNCHPLTQGGPCWPHLNPIVPCFL